jgi:hypothetical protein
MVAVRLATDWAVAAGTLGLAAATVFLGLVAVRQLRQTRDAVHEAYRARVDDLAPKVTLLILRPFHPPYSASEYGNPQPWPPTKTFTMPRDADTRILVRTQGYLMNEGDTTAVVEAGGAVAFPPPKRYLETPTGRGSKVLNEHDDPAENVEGFPELSTMTYLKGSRWALQPGQVVALRATTDRPLREWVEGWHRRGTDRPMKLRFEVRVMDQYEDGIEDHHVVEVEAYPVVPVRGNEAGWQVPSSAVGDDGFDRADALPVRRRYRREAHTSRLRQLAFGRLGRA